MEVLGLPLGALETRLVLLWDHLGLLGRYLGSLLEVFWLLLTILGLWGVSEWILDRFLHHLGCFLGSISDDFGKVLGQILDVFCDWTSEKSMSLCLFAA